MEVYSLKGFYLFICLLGVFLVCAKKCRRIASYCFRDSPTRGAFAMSEYLYLLYTPLYNPPSPSPALTHLNTFTSLPLCTSSLYTHYIRCIGSKHWRISHVTISIQCEIMMAHTLTGNLPQTMTIDEAKSTCLYPFRVPRNVVERL